MKVPDANILIYAVHRDATRHDACRQWLETSLGSAEPVGLTWLVLLAFLRVTTNARLFDRPLAVSEAMDFIDELVDQPAATIISPTERHAAILRGLLLPTGGAGNLTSDAHLAALAIEHGATLISCDSDFSRFAGLTWREPS